MAETQSKPISLLDKYPHLRLLAAKRREMVKPDAEEKMKVMHSESGGNDTVSEGVGRISLLGSGPGLVRRTSSVVSLPVVGTRTRVDAEQLFAASVAADDDHWLQFQVELGIPARDQLDQLNMWLVSNRPSTIARSSGVGWIAVKFKDKGKKVLEAKAAWDSHEGEKTMEVVNDLAQKFQVLGGKWMCHLPSGLIDGVWSKLATALMCGGLGPSVYMVKVSPVEDMDPNLSRGEHVICVYNTDYKDTEQVMRVENLMRSAGVETVLNYKPDIFSALGIYRNNKWGFRPTIYSSRAMFMEGKSRVETVGTGNWYYNSSKGLQYPDCGQSGALIRRGKAGQQDKENNNVRSSSGVGKRTQPETKNLNSRKAQVGGADRFNFESMDSMKNMTCQSSNNKASSGAGKTNTNGKVNPVAAVGKDKESQKSSWSHRLATKKPVDVDITEEVRGATLDSSVKKSDAQVPAVPKSWSHRLAAKHNNKNESSNKAVKEVSKVENFVPTVEEDALKDKEVKTVSSSLINEVSTPSLGVTSEAKPPAAKKPAWLKKLEELKLKNLDDMKTG